MIGPIVSIIESLVITSGLAVSRGIDRSAARRRVASPRIVRRTSEGAVRDLITALHSERQTRVAAEAENTRLRKQLENAREVIDILAA